MTRFPDSRVLSAIALLLVATTAIEARAQTCRGMPRGGGVGFVVGDQLLGSSYGVALSKGAVGVGFNSLTGNDRISSWDANLRFTLAKGGALQWCPSIGFEYRNDDITVSDGSTLTARIGTAAAGLAFGYEREVYKGVSVIPFAGVDYQFTAIVFSLDTPDGEEGELSGDTLSHVSIRYGAIAKYRNFYGGFAGDRYLESDIDRPYRVRWILGFAFSGSSRSSRVASVPTPGVRERERRQ